MPTSTAIATNLQQQLESFVQAGYPELAGLSESEFEELGRAAIAAVGPVATEPDAPGIGALLVVTRALIAPELRVPLLRIPISDKPGIVDRNHDSDARKGLEHYAPRAELGVPDAPMYVVYGVERGDEFLGVAPRDALPAIASRGRTPLTIDEGISLVTVAPELLVKNHCFMLAGSTRGDKRVPALWIADKAPKLGWCFDGVPHSWLGIASAAGRYASTDSSRA